MARFLKFDAEDMIGVRSEETLINIGSISCMIRGKEKQTTIITMNNGDVFKVNLYLDEIYLKTRIEIVEL